MGFHRLGTRLSAAVISSCSLPDQNTVRQRNQDLGQGRVRLVDGQQLAAAMVARLAQEVVADFQVQFREALRSLRVPAQSDPEFAA